MHGGSLVMVGLAQDEMTVPMSTVVSKELNMMGSFRYANTVCVLGCFVPLRTPLKGVCDIL